MRIGPYQLENNLILAPMAGVTDRPFRQLCKNLGAGLAVSEMVSSLPNLRASEKSKRRADHEGETTPRSIQIVGADPALMADAARHNVDEGAQIIDINMGCPAKKVCHVMAGSALLRDEKLVGEILDRVVNAVDVPVTLKIRTGWSPDQRNAVAIARIAEQAGIQALTIHGRTRACAFKGDVEYDTIAAVKSVISIPLIANGDITTPQRAQQVLQYTGADAVMIGRAAQGWPWIFREIDYFLKTGCLLAPPTIAEIRTTLLTHLENLYDFYGEYQGVRIARKHIGWYCKHQHGADDFRRRINTVESARGQFGEVALFFDLLDTNMFAAA